MPWAQTTPLFPQAQIIAQAIGQAFGVAYQRFLEANSIDPSELSPRQYSRALEDQEQYNAELTHFSRQENCKDVRTALEGWGQCGVPTGTSVSSPPQLPEHLRFSLQKLSPIPAGCEPRTSVLELAHVPHDSGDRNLSVPPSQVCIRKQKGEILGIAIVESGWGSILPTVVIANLMHGGPAERSGELSIGDRLMSVNRTSLVGLPLTTCQSIIRVSQGCTWGGLLPPPWQEGECCQRWGPV